MRPSAGVHITIFTRPDEHIETENELCELKFSS